MLDESFARPATFDVRRFWEDWTHTFEASRPRLVARLAVAPTIYREFRQSSAWPVEKVEEPDGHSPDYRLSTWRMRRVASSALHLTSTR